ncbi:Six-hairpin glycosidase-like protein [Amylostereum chailletii]|nr:Six-hairpin glycosidase-like protein [Amylostereum chailletii]
MLKLFLWLAVSSFAKAVIDRRAVVSRYNPVRTTTSNFTTATTPMQVGNGNFAFGADFTGLQTFLPFATMSSWGWKNDTLPANTTWDDVENYQGVSWDNHGRPVQYDFGGDALIQQWLISNPNRANLARVGLLFRSSDGEPLNSTDADVADVSQSLDLWSGTLSSRFTLDNQSVTVNTSCAQDSDTISVSISSPLLGQGRLGLFLDFPWNDGSQKFSAPFVGSFDATANHTTSLDLGPNLGSNVVAQITHTMVNSTFFTAVGGAVLNISRDSPEAHRYTLLPVNTTADQLALTLSFSPNNITTIPEVQQVIDSSTIGWEDYWSSSGFVDVVSSSSDPRANELQRRVVLSRYLMRVNEAGDSPPQESGLVNDGWYGKFHMEMYFWHSAHWALWNNWDLLRRSSSIYSRFLSTSIIRAQVQQGWSAGARWPKMTDPSGRSSPGEINNLLIWEQPHPLVFAAYERRAFPRDRNVLGKWKDVIKATADWMAAFAWWNVSTGVYDIGPPMYPVAEDTNPNVTRNPAFELAYWRLGLDIARDWFNAAGEEIPETWTNVQQNLAPLPVEDGLYSIYEDAPADFWDLPEFTNDHPALSGLYGWLPPTADLDLTIANATAHKVYTSWNISNCWGWDFPMLAMSAARLGDREQAIEWLLHPLFQFDDVGMPVGGVRAPTPYFPGSGALLYSIAMMAKGWNGSTGTAPGFPRDGWSVQVEGLAAAL